MKTFAIVLGCVTMVVVLLVAGVWIGATLSRGSLGATPLGWAMMGSGMMRGNWNWEDWASGRSCAGPGMMLQSWNNMPCGQGYNDPDTNEIASLEDAKAAVESYVERLGYTGLETTEVMEFGRNFYAIVA